MDKFEPVIHADSNIWIARSADTLPRQHMMSSVVLQELLAGAVDKTAVQKYEAMKRGYEKADKLLVPDGDDWFAAGRILNALLRGLKSKRGGTIPKLPYQEQYRGCLVSTADTLLNTRKVNTLQPGNVLRRGRRHPITAHYVGHARRVTTAVLS